MTKKPKHPITIPELAYIISRYRVEVEESGGASGKIKSWSNTWPPCFPLRTHETLRKQTSLYITNDNPNSAQTARRLKAEQHIQGAGGVYNVVRKAGGRGHRTTQMIPNTTVLTVSTAMKPIPDIKGGLTMTLHPTSMFISGTACIDVDDMTAEDALMQWFRGGTIGASIKMVHHMTRVLGRLKSITTDIAVWRRLGDFEVQLHGAMGTIPLDASAEEQYVGAYGFVDDRKDQALLEELCND
jgi:hypothetical protein